MRVLVWTPEYHAEASVTAADLSSVSGSFVKGLVRVRYGYLVPCLNTERLATPCPNLHSQEDIASSLPLLPGLVKFDQVKLKLLIHQVVSDGTVVKIHLESMSHET